MATVADLTSQLGKQVPLPPSMTGTGVVGPQTGATGASGASPVQNQWPAWQNPNLPAPPPAGSVPPAPTGPNFLPPATGITPSAAISSQPDPKIAALIAQLGQQASTVNAPAPLAPLNVAPPNFNASSGQSAQLQALIAQLQAGKGPQVGSVSNDPAVVAYNVSAQRSAERQRQSEADRTAASGVSGGGDFDSRVAQIGEQTGVDEANYAANLSNQRQRDMTATALSGAQLGLSQIGQANTLAEQQYADAMQQAQADRSATEFTQSQTQQRAEADRASNQALLAQLLGEQGRTQGFAQTQADAAAQLAIEKTKLSRQIDPTTGLPYKTPTSVGGNTYGTSGITG